ncbi:LiaF transmembrane domain-containing protein [Pedobacter sp. JCM 36344]|uniref:LiaF transmembrane domain-containing protein n=1 Tax=Pedobacter sp. JCM 36344 TaxID=3374280 RepID=UPI003979EA3F
METLNRKNNRNFNIGILFIIIGGIFIVRNLGILVPFWILSWKSFLLIVGLLIGYNRNFRPGGWIVMVIIGSMLTLKSIVLFSLGDFALPIILIGLGLYVILKPKHNPDFCTGHFRKDKLNFDQSSPEAK